MRVRSCVRRLSELLLDDAHGIAEDVKCFSCGGKTVAIQHVESRFGSDILRRSEGVGVASTTSTRSNHARPTSYSRPSRYGRPTSNSHTSSHTYPVPVWSYRYYI